MTAQKPHPIHTILVAEKIDRMRWAGTWPTKFDEVVTESKIASDLAARGAFSERDGEVVLSNRAFDAYLAGLNR